MKKTLKTLSLAASALSLAFATTACAQQQKPAPVASTQVAVTEVELNGPALWKVADEDTTVYLFGTVHLLPEDVDWYTGSIPDALASSDKLITEIHLDDAAKASLATSMMARGSLPEGQTLRALLTEEQKATYEQALAKLNIPPEVMDRFEPWMVAVNLSLIPLLQNGYSAESGVEEALESEAGDKPRGQLETAAFQIDMFDSMPMDTQIAYLMELAENIDDVLPTLNAIVGEWVEGDANGIAELMNASMTDPAIAETLLYSRNRNWAEWIDTRLNMPGTVFIAVGAGHLAGQQSVQQYLETRGIKSIRVQ